MTFQSDTTGIVGRIQDLAPLSMWVGAVIGVFVSAVFVGVVSFGKRVRRIKPIRRLLGDLADNKADCDIFVRQIFSDTGCYKSKHPDYLPPHTSGKTTQWRNIQFVVSTADMRAATDFTNLLGQVGKKERVLFRSEDRDWALWDTNVVVIGGGFKADRIFEFAKPARITLSHSKGSFKAVSGETFKAEAGNDYGLIYKVTNPENHRKCILIMGLGVHGTAGAIYYLKTRAQRLGKMFAGGDFAFVVRVRVDRGPELVTPGWYSPEPVWFRKMAHWVTWRRMLRGVRHGVE